MFIQSGLLSDFPPTKMTLGDGHSPPSEGPLSNNVKLPPGDVRGGGRNEIPRSNVLLHLSRIPQALTMCGTEVRDIQSGAVIVRLLKSTVGWSGASPKLMITSRIASARIGFCSGLRSKRPSRAPMRCTASSSGNLPPLIN